MKYLFSLLLLCAVVGCKTHQIKTIVEYESNSLVIQKIAPSTYIHTTYLASKSYGKVACNGMIYINDGEAMIFDTPTLDSVSIELIEYVEDNLKATIKGIVINHFHIDCLGGLEEFHKRGISSYANNETIKLARAHNKVIPKEGFDKRMELKVGGEKVINEYFGPGHTSDNIVSYIASEEILFGGCLIKKVGSGKGNLNDANVDEWSNTVRIIKAKYPKLKQVIPGHGKSGGIALLDYTIELFRSK